MKITKETILKTLNSLPMPTWIKRIFNMIIEYTSDISNLITNKADLVDGKVPAEQLPSYVDDVIEFNNVQAPDTQISIIVGNNSYKNQIRFINGSSTSSNRIGSEDKYPYMFVNFGENTSEDDWTTFEPEQGKIYINTTNNRSYRWSGSQLIDLDKSWSQGIKDLQENTIRTDISQDFSTEEENQALSNIGSGLLVVNLVNGQATLTKDQEAKLLSSSGVILRGTVNAGKEVLTKIYYADYQEGTVVSFYAIRNNRYILKCDYDKQTKIFRFASGVNYIDPNAVSIKSQTLTEAQQEQAWLNLGLDLVVLKFPKGVTSITLTDKEDAKLQSGAAVLVTVDGTNTSTGVRDADNHIFVSYNFTNRPEPRYYSLWSHTSTLYCSYNKASKTFVYNGSLQLNDTGALRFDSLAPLTASQKDTALSNIGLGFVIVDYSELSTTLSDDRLSQLVNAKGFILTNTPDDYTRAVVFTAGTRLVNSITFSSVEDAQNINYIVLNIPNKTLSLVQTSKLIIGNFNQNLTNTEKDTVLSNIGLNFVHVDYSLLETTLTDEMFAVLDNAKGIILVGLPSNYYNPFVFIKGNNTSNNCIFVGFATGTMYCQIKLDKSTKILSNIHGNLTYAGTVRYIEKQSLTDTQKQQARSNIGATSCYDEYKLAGGTKYTTEADFNAQLVKVMDMTVVE